MHHHAAPLRTMPTWQMLRHDFEEKWSKLLGSSRCFHFLGSVGGALILGAHERTGVALQARLPPAAQRPGQLPWSLTRRTRQTQPLGARVRL